MLRKLLLARISPTVAGKRLALPVIPLVIALCCCGCFAAVLVDESMRAIGLLPTYTPSPTRTHSPTPSKTLIALLQPTFTATRLSISQPTATPSPTSPPTRTPTLRPTERPTITPTTAPTLVSGPLVVIRRVNKTGEYVDLENRGDQTQDLTGWRLVSERGNQVCYLAGVVQPGEILRVWTRNPNGGGHNCGFENNIWNDNESDPAALYDSQGVLVSRYP